MQLFHLTAVGRSGTTACTRMLNLVKGVGCVHERGQQIIAECSHPSDKARIIFPEMVKGVLQKMVKETNPDKKDEKFEAVGVKVPFPDSFHCFITSCKDLKTVAIVRHPLDIFLSQFACEQGVTNPGWPSHVSSFNGGAYKANIVQTFVNYITNLRDVHVVKYEYLFNNPDELMLMLEYLGVKRNKVHCVDAFAKTVTLGNRPSGDIDMRFGCVDCSYRENYKKEAEFYRKLIKDQLSWFMNTFGYLL